MNSRPVVIEGLVQDVDSILVMICYSYHIHCAKHSREICNTEWQIWLVSKWPINNAVLETPSACAQALYFCF